MFHEKLTKEDLVIIAICICIALTGTVAIDMHLPTLPQIVDFYHSTNSYGQASISLYLAGMLGMQLVYGPLSDKYGRKPILIIGLVIASLGSIVCAHATSMPIFLFGRLIQGLGAASGMSLFRSVLNDSLSMYKLSAYGSYASIVVSMGLMFAPILGAYLAHISKWQSVFYAMSCFFFLVALLTAYCLPETNAFSNDKKKGFKAIIKTYAKLCIHPVFIGFNICAAVSVSTNIVYTSISPFLFQIDYKLSAIQYGWLGVIFGFTAILGKFIAGQSLKKIGSFYSILIGLAIFLASGIAILVLVSLHLTKLWHIVAAVGLCTMGQGFVVANAMTLALGHFKHIGGAASAMYGTTNFTLGFIVSSVLSLIHNFDLKLLACSYLILSILGAIAYKIGKVGVDKIEKTKQYKKH